MGKRTIYGVLLLAALLLASRPAPAGQAADCPLLGVPDGFDPADGKVVFYDPDDPNIWITWSDVVGVAGYEYEITRAGTGEVIDADTIDGTAVVITPGVGTYSVRVRAVSPVEGCPRGEWSPTVTFEVIEPRTYDVTDVAASQGLHADRVAVTWKVDTGQEYTLRPDWFLVYRAESPTASWDEPVELVRLDYADQPEGYRYDDLTAEPGVHYYYWVRSHGLIRTGIRVGPAEGWAAAASVAPYVIYLPLVGR